MSSGFVASCKAPNSQFHWLGTIGKHGMQIEPKSTDLAQAFNASVLLSQILAFSCTGSLSSSMAAHERPAYTTAYIM